MPYICQPCFPCQFHTVLGFISRITAWAYSSHVLWLERPPKGRVCVMAVDRATKHSVQTASGRISYVEQGSGPVALFVHGVLLNGYLWRHQLGELSNIRRVIAVDLLAHGDTEITADQDVS